MSAEHGPMRELCARIDRVSVARRSVERIRRELPRYHTIAFEEHLSAVASQQANQLEALAAGRVVSGAALEEAAELARSRARQGIEIEVLIGAYHLGDQVMWDGLMEVADNATFHLLPRATTLLLASLHALSTALTAAHAEASQAMQGRRITATQRLLELLLGEEVGPEARTQAEMLGLRADGEFVAAVWRNEPEVDMGPPQELLARFEISDVELVVGRALQDHLFLCQGASAASFGTVLHSTLQTGTAAVGLERPGLVGAALSLGDAFLALGSVAAQSGEKRERCSVTDFAAVWPDACLEPAIDRLRPLLEPVAQMALQHPHLADAVVAFARSDMHFARAAATLHLHPNSLGYRLQRWGALTGWDPRTFDGLRRSLVAVAAAGDGVGAGRVGEFLE